MTLRDWLKMSRRPDHLGINARLHLKDYGARNSHKRTLRRVMLDVAIGCAPDLKHELHRTYLLPQRA